MTYKTIKKYIAKRKVAVFLLVAFILVAGSVLIIRKVYEDNLKPLSNSNAGQVITIESGSTVSEIGDTLQNKGVIKSDWAFEWYVRNHELRNELQAGTYLLYPSQSVPEIVGIIVDGKIATDLITILPGQRLDQIREAFIKAGFSEDSVDKALDPSRYKNHPALSDKPVEASLEGYLYPESFQKDINTKPEDLVSSSLDEMYLHLTPDIRQAVNKQGFTLHQAIIIASIVEQEVTSDSDKSQAAQVFIKRYKEGMNLGADPTALYGAALDGVAKVNKRPNFSYNTPYNTHLYEGLPPGPISNFLASSLQAVAFPAQTDWLYFVSGDDGKTYFSKTLEEHEELTRKHCSELCGN